MIERYCRSRSRDEWRPDVLPKSSRRAARTRIWIPGFQKGQSVAATIRVPCYSSWVMKSLCAAFLCLGASLLPASAMQDFGGPAGELARLFQKIHGTNLVKKSIEDWT